MTIIYKTANMLFENVKIKKRGFTIKESLRKANIMVFDRKNNK